MIDKAEAARQPAPPVHLAAPLDLYKALICNAVHVAAEEGGLQLILDTICYPCYTNTVVKGQVCPDTDQLRLIMA